jgi:hypothetical protein
VTSSDGMHAETRPGAPVWRAQTRASRGPACPLTGVWSGSVRRETGVAETCVIRSETVLGGGVVLEKLLDDVFAANATRDRFVVRASGS